MPGSMSPGVWMTRRGPCFLMSHFELRFGSQDPHCRRKKGSNLFAPEFTFKTIKHPPKIMVSSCFSWRGQGGIEMLKTGEMMNGVRYRQLLEEKLELFMDRQGCTHFLQDGAPCHYRLSQPGFSRGSTSSLWIGLGTGPRRSCRTTTAPTCSSGKRTS